MQRAADSRDGVIRHGLPQQDTAVGASSPATAVVVVAAPGQTVHQVPHGIFTCGHGKTESDSDSVIGMKKCKSKGSDAERIRKVGKDE